MIVGAAADRPASAAPRGAAGARSGEGRGHGGQRQDEAEQDEEQRRRARDAAPGAAARRRLVNPARDFMWYVSVNARRRASRRLSSERGGLL